MTVSAVSPIVSYLGNGVTTEFDFTFPIPTGSGTYRVFLQDSETYEFVADLDDDEYSITFNADRTGTVEAVVAPPATRRIVIERTVPLTQDLLLQKRDAFSGPAVMRGMDRLTMQIQDMRAIVDRAIITDYGVPAARIIGPKTENATLIFDEDGNIVAGEQFDDGSVPTPITAVHGFYPDDYGDVHGADDTAAVLLAQTAANLYGGCLEFIAGDYTISETLVITDDNQHIRVAPGAKLKAHASFTGDSLIHVGDPDEPLPWEFWSVTGGGVLDPDNNIDYGIYVQWGRFSRIQDLNIFGANISGVVIGEDGTDFASYEVDLNNVRCYYNDVHNDPNSIGIHFANATDCHADTCYAIGYRRGIRTEQGSIELSGCHVWNRPVHGPLERGFDLQGRSPIAMHCYADSPTVYDPDGITLTDAYGFYLHGFNPQLIGCHVIMNTSQSPDTSVDGTVTAFYMDREVFGSIDGAFIEGGTSGTKRYKSYFEGSVSNGTTFRNIMTGGDNYVVDTASNRIVESPSGGATRYHRSATIFTASARFQNSMIAEGDNGLQVKQNGSGSAYVMFLRSDSTRAFTLHKNSSHNLRIDRYNSSNVYVDTPFEVNNSTGAIALANALTVASSVQATQEIINGNAGTNRDIIFRTGGVDRIKIRANSASEAGANAGSNERHDMYDDSGVYLFTAFELTRATGDATFYHDITAGGTPYFKPAASVSLGTNGQVTLEFTDNTHITLKGRGSDGVTRSQSFVIA